MKTKSSPVLVGIGLGVLLLSVMACGLGSQTAVPATITPLPPATETNPPGPTEPLLYLSVQLETTPLNEQGTNPDYSLDGQVPVLQGSNDPRVINFNNEMTLLIQEEIAVFKDNLRQLSGAPGGNGSSFHETYSLLSGLGNIFSLKFEFMVYIEGAAHPSTYSRVRTYDLESGADISLSQLFLPGSDYLQVLSNYCLAKLSASIPDLSTAGVDPTEANYRSWNITPDGLLITFDEYQVAAYALGAQTVVVPYTELQAIIDPNGPLVGFLP